MPPTSRTRRILRALSSSAAPRWAIAVGVLLALPALSVGWFNDDLLQTLELEGAYGDIGHRPWAAYDFSRPETPTASLVAQGYMPWFTERALSFRFFRPLSSLTMALDHALFGRDAFAPHLHGLLWYLALLLFVSRIHARVLRPAEATVATLVYAASSAPAFALTWVAARHALMGGALAAGAIALHVGSRQTPRDRARGAGSVALLALGLASSESALAAVPVIVLFEALAMDDRVSTRVVRALPAPALALAHLVHYTLADYGTRGSGGYVSPFSDPAEFALAFVERGPVLLGEIYGGAPSILWAAAEPIRPALAGYGFFAIIAVVTLLVLLRAQLRGRERRRLAWLLLSSMTAIVPMVGGFIGGRLLFIAGIGASALIGVALVQLALATDRPRWLRGVAIAALVVPHLVLAPLARVGFVAIARQLTEAHRTVASSVDVDACPDGNHLLVIDGADPANSMYLEQSLRFYRPDARARFATVQALSMVPQDHVFARVGDDAFTLTAVGDRGRYAFEDVYRRAPLAVGDELVGGPLTVRVEAMANERWTRARFEVEGGLDRVCFATWDGEGIRVVEPGPRWEIPHVPGPGG